MPTTRECDFCGDDIEPGTGTMFVKINGTVTHFCSSKCEKNADLGREARDHQWTAAGQAVAPEDQSAATEPPSADVDTAPEPEPTTDTAAEPEEPEHRELPTEPDEDTEPTDVTPNLAAVEAETKPAQDDVEADEEFDTDDTDEDPEHSQPGDDESDTDDTDEDADPSQAHGEETDEE